MVKFNKHKSKQTLNMLASIVVYPRGIRGYYMKLRRFFLHIINNTIYDNFMTLCVTANTISLAIDRYDIPAT